MEVNRKYHPKRVNPITKEHTRCVLIDKWILAQILGIPNIQFPDHINIKMKKDQSEDTMVLLRNGNKISSEGDREKVWSRVKERQFRDYPTWGSNTYTVTKPRTLC